MHQTTLGCSIYLLGSMVTAVFGRVLTRSHHLVCPAKDFTIAQSWTSMWNRFASIANEIWPSPALNDHPEIMSASLIPTLNFYFFWHKWKDFIAKMKRKYKPPSHKWPTLNLTATRASIQYLDYEQIQKLDIVCAVVRLHSFKGYTKITFMYYSAISPGSLH